VKVVTYLLSVLIGLLGLIFVVGSQQQVWRIIIGIILILAAFVLVYLTRVRAQTITTTNVQQIDLSGDVALEEIRCRSCNAPLSKEDIDVKAGAILVSCSHCGATYQFEEEPKW